MNILVLSHMYPSSCDEHMGDFVHHQVKELQRQGCGVRVISPLPLTPFPAACIPRRWRAYSQVPLETMWDGVEVHYPRYLSLPRSLLFASAGRRTYSGIRRVVQELSRDFGFDIIHAHMALPAGSAGAMLKRQYDRPLVVTIHGADIHVTIHKGPGCRNAVREVLQQADRTVCVSTELRRMAISSLGFSEKLEVINNGINPADIASSNFSLPPRHNASSVIVSVSTLTAAKGLDFNLKAFSKLAGKHPNLRYWVIGGGPEERSLKQLADSLNLGNRVEFLGQMPHERVMQYMAAADILSLPSWREGFGIVYLEAMAHAKPVIACQGQGIIDVIEDGKTGLLVKPRDVPSLVQAMDFLLGNPEKAQAIGDNGRKLVLEKYTLEISVRKYMELYEELSTTHA